MGKMNLAVNQLLERREIFADLINGSLFSGRQFVKADGLKMLSVHTGIMRTKEQNESGIAALEKFGDIRMESDMGAYTVVWAEETQNKVDYAMPVRNMLYDALEYTKQIKMLENQHKQAGEKLNEKEFLSGIKKEDHLKPVITLVLYCGKEWDGSKSLIDMFGIDEDSEAGKIIQMYLPDYRIHLIQPDQIEDMTVFKTSLQQIFSMIKYKTDKVKLIQYMQEHETELRHLDYTESIAAFELLGESQVAEKYLFSTAGEKGEVKDMCKAFDELRMDWKEEGREEGREEVISVLINVLKEFDYSEEQIVKQMAERLNISEERAWRSVKNNKSVR